MPLRKSAFSKALQEAQQPQKRQSSETEERLYSETMTQQELETVEQLAQTSCYLTAEQVEK